jgi:hypothetical protein
VLAVADGAGTSAVARQVGVSPPTVIKGDRFVAHDLAGSEDEERSRRPKTVDDARDHRGHPPVPARSARGMDIPPDQTASQTITFARELAPDCAANRVRAEPVVQGVDSLYPDPGPSPEDGTTAYWGPIRTVTSAISYIDVIRRSSRLIP